MPEPIRPTAAWSAYKEVHDHIQSVGMVDKATDDSLKVLEDFIRQELERIVNG